MPEPSGNGLKEIALNLAQTGKAADYGNGKPVE